MSEFPYPNREHELADKRARRRAVQAVERLEDELAIIKGHLLAHGSRVDADTTQSLSGYADKITGLCAELGTLYDVRQWHAADVNEGKIIEIRES